MEQEVFTDKLSGAAFCEKVAGKQFTIKLMKNGKKFFISNSDEYPKGYIADAASDILESQKQAGKSLKEALCLLTFANIHTDDGEVIPALIPTPQEPETYWSMD